jgi:uncharacterized membrane protein
MSFCFVFFVVMVVTNPHGINSRELWDAYWVVAIVGYLLGFAGVILLIYGQYHETHQSIGIITSNL